MIERSVVLIKPDGVERNIIGNILSCYEANGLKIVELKLMRATREIAEKHYSQHKGKDFYEELITFITRSPLCAVILKGEDAVARIRKINGATSPTDAEEGSIRHRYARSKTENCVHASDTVESAKEEIALWFPEVEN
ncbi:MULTISPECIES: nucleoside-diphosphate kinase [Clostridium]|jgi:nucleoside-diphosphate kinase|uniref:Nucleoside diphosphate kinase n=1 Tax=Clostridium saccharoperbutylacetonicum N1-4(HMT) TaxID=931276 RepID=M1MUA2_9CLOT|nr:MULTISPECIES: nucleoside-diphosphate kinase [Clostridium]AGF58241.1 nucleoside diphosphate kinase Ndk [Clostridium saccharoperbutylacetonicum N1-4(HMT)]AQR96926.1 nucleoside diphosphate kinase [Clostridium saccharoperbutylacetonicum]NRT60982.1 nucleoside-diphosphate kinase [Clostridium saccharoperbutylacetonicum]NSB24295.1 nucleoside-diphosphate kinase [Clostridium saccharoperbutylacetonicum]NSB32805.1 nucleoside-diphosphate kinase [Clostridium saccharoperbutylacetonicum]